MSTLSEILAGLGGAASGVLGGYLARGTKRVEVAGSAAVAEATGRHSAVVADISETGKINARLFERLDKVETDLRAERDKRDADRARCVEEIDALMTRIETLTEQVDELRAQRRPTDPPPPGRSP